MRKRLDVFGGNLTKSSSAAHLSTPTWERFPQTDRLPLIHCLRHDGMRSCHLFQPLGNPETRLMRKNHYPHGVKIDSPDPQPRGHEIICRGTNLMLGYYRMPEPLPKSPMSTAGCTGDLATMDADGYVTVRGRNRGICFSLPADGTSIPEEIEEKTE